MSIRILLIMLCAALGIWSPLQAEENIAIRGAFGIWFGEMLDTAGQDPIYKGEDGVRAYAVNDPPSPYDALDEYTVFVTEEGRIYEIVGEGSLGTPDACFDELVFMTEVVARKYPGAARLASDGRLIRRTVLRQRNHLVEIVCLDKDLAVRYRDDDVMKQRGRLISNGAGGQMGLQSAEVLQRDTSGL